MKLGPAVWLRAGLLLALLGLTFAVEGTRDGVFVGYKESGVQGAEGGREDAAAVDDLTTASGNDGDSSLHVAANEAADGVEAAGGSFEGRAAAGASTGGAAMGAQGGEAAAAGDLATGAAEVGRTVKLHTQFGPIKAKLLEKLAPRTTALVWDLAQRRGCRNCAFYRNEGRPRSGDGPPYALLQGRLDMPEVAPREGNIEVKMGHVCFIPETKDFFIAYGDHPEWGTSHTVWGLVDEWFAVDFIISQQYQETTHPDFGTVMRMLKTEVPLKIATEQDTFYSSTLGPMHYEEPPL